MVWWAFHDANQRAVASLVGGMGEVGVESGSTAVRQHPFRRVPVQLGVKVDAERMDAAACYRRTPAPQQRVGPGLYAFMARHC